MKYVYIVVAESYEGIRIVACFDNEASAIRFRDGADKENKQAIQEYLNGYSRPIMNTHDGEDHGMHNITYFVSKHQLHW